ncbi:ComEC/Rec2 family competence protein [Candidatus Nomurabacteria bacterium]|jgi:competence protein ComEC|nr:MAG: ComEC/Rec2 family competence protein [Candidatus Nomurabacteria bacterium]
MQRYLLFIVMLAFGIGILTASYVPIPINILCIFIGIGVLLFFLQFVFQKRKNIFLLISILLLAFTIGIVRTQFAIIGIPPYLEELVGDNVSFTGEIIAKPDVRESSTRLIVESTNLVPDEKVRLLVVVGPYENISYGDTLKVTGIVETPENFQTDQGKEFDYVSYLGKDDVYLIVPKAKASVIDTRPRSLLKMLYNITDRFSNVISDAVPAPESTFEQGILLGAKSGLSQELRNAFITTSTIHIVALSGYNVSIVARAIENIFSSFLSQTFALSLGGLGIVLFVLATGAQATAIRAGVMALLAIIAKRTGRTYMITRALFIAGALMLLWNPKLLAFDVSFQLSFIATAGIIWITPILLQKLSWIRILWFKDIIATTIGAQIAVAPLILYKMGTFSLIALPVNIIILPFIPIAMLLGFFIGVIGLASPVLAMPFGYLLYLLLHSILFIVVTASHIPFAMVVVSHFPFILALILYLALLYWLYRTHRNRSNEIKDTAF